MTKAHQAAADLRSNSETDAPSGFEFDCPPPDCDPFGSQIKSALLQHQSSLVRYAQHFVGDLERARDVVQDTFLKLCSQSKSDPLFEDESHLAKWLFRVCRNRAIDVGRKESRMKLVNPEQMSGAVSEIAAVDHQAEQRETAEQVNDHIARLPDNQREVLRLKFQGGLSYKEIAGVTGLTTSNVGFLLHTAIKKLKTQMG